MGKEITGYNLSRAWFDFCFENPEIIKPNHTALYFFAIEHCNRLGWKEKFGFPTEMAKDAIGIKNYKTYINTLNDLVEWGFITMIEKSKNQYSANIIALVKNTKAHTKALSKATSKHMAKQVQSTYQSIDSINKPNNQLTEEPLNNKIPFDDFWDLYEKKTSRDKCEKKWDKLSLEDQQAAMEYIPKYKIAQPDKKYRKNPETFLYNKSWNDEIIGESKKECPEGYFFDTKTGKYKPKLST